MCVCVCVVCVCVREGGGGGGGGARTLISMTGEEFSSFILMGGLSCFRCVCVCVCVCMDVFGCVHFCFSRPLKP